MRGQLRSKRLKERKVKYHIRLKQRGAQHVYGENLVQKSQLKEGNLEVGSTRQNEDTLCNASGINEGTYVAKWREDIERLKGV